MLILLLTNLQNTSKGKCFDIILCGIDSSDYNGSLVGGMLAEFLDILLFHQFRDWILKEVRSKLKREIDGGQEVLVTKHLLWPLSRRELLLNPGSLPCVVS